METRITFFFFAIVVAIVVFVAIAIEFGRDISLSWTIVYRGSCLILCSKEKQGGFVVFVECVFGWFSKSW